MSKFVPRTTAPNKTDKRAINYKYGGTSIAIAIDTQSGYTMPNCVGYFNFRMAEILGLNSVNWKIPACNAEDCYDKAIENGWQVGQTPKLGAGIVWRSGKTHNASDGAGHIGIVEEIKENGDLVISQSAWGGQEFYLSTVTKASGYAYRPDRPLVGFIYCGIEFEKPQPTFKPIKDGIDYSLVFNANFYLNKYADLRKAFGNSEEQAFNHFLTFGMKEHRQAISNFIVDIYKDNYVDLRNAFGEDSTKYYIHYIQFGYKEGRNATTPIKKELTPTSYPNYPANSGKSYKVMKKPSGWGDSLGCFTNYSTPSCGGAFYVWAANKTKGYHLYDNEWKQLD